MSKIPARPADLPDFERPPINEVVLGIQFSPPFGYQQIRAGEVWNLYKKKYPEVQEQPPLQPSFEIFGLPSKSRAGQISFIDGPLHNRFWFLNAQGDELIQFQQDRLLHNWRKVGDQTNTYPHFESMIKDFEDELLLLQAYASSLAPQALAINQCEISYINHIHIGSPGDESASHWFKFVAFPDRNPEDFAISFREIIRDSDGTPLARLICEAAHAINAVGQRIIGLTLTVRGAPRGSDVDSALMFMAKGRDLIVRRFAELTTDIAHEKWGRIKHE